MPGFTLFDLTYLFLYTDIYGAKDASNLVLDVNVHVFQLT